MNRSSYIWQDIFENNYATPHDATNRTQIKQKYENGNSAYSLQTTAEDYSKFMLAILNQKGLKKSTVAELLRPQTKVEGENTRQ